LKVKWMKFCASTPKYAASMIDKERDRFVNFDQVKSRVDILMHETMAGKDMYSKLWNVVRMLLVISHGQAAVERGFSINKIADRNTTCTWKNQRKQLKQNNQDKKRKAVSDQID